MIKRHYSEKIFLQPIDQHYNSETPTEDSLKFCNDFDKMIDDLNMSTDSDSNSRKYSTDDETSYRIESVLKNCWKENIESLKVSYMYFYKNILFHKIEMFRNLVDSNVKGRTYSCPNKNMKPNINPFMRKSFDVNPFEGMK